MLLPLGTMASNKQYFHPQKEILKPISLPRKTFSLSIGATANIDPTDMPIAFYNADLLGFNVPYIPIKDRSEFYIIPLIIRSYPIKNVECKNNELVITGPNFAIDAGIFTLGYYRSTGIMINYGLRLKFKTFLSQKVWLHSYLSLTLNEDLYIHTGESVGLGFQLNDRISLIQSIRGSTLHHVETQNLRWFDIDLPFDLRFNINKKNNLLFRIGFKFYRNEILDETKFLIPIGAQYTRYISLFKKLKNHNGN